MLIKTSSASMLLNQCAVGASSNLFGT